MPQTSTPLVSIIKRLLNTGDRWTKQAILLVFYWFLFVLTAAFAPIGVLREWAVFAVVIMPLIATGILVYKYNTVVHIAALVSQGRQGLRKLAMLLAGQLLVGLFFMLVPVHHDPWVLAVILVAGAAYALLRIAGVRNALTALLVLVVVGSTIVLFQGGREGITERAEAKPSPAEEKIGEYPLCTDADQEHRFSDNVDQITVTAQPRCWSGEVSVPPNSEYLITPEEGGTIDIVFWDGTLVRDGPGEGSNWVGVKRGVFRIAGVDEAVETTITIERK